MKRRGRASCAICRKSFLRPSWYMRSAGHSSRQRRDGPSIRIGATTRFGPINSPARSLPLAARRKDGCGKSESRNRGHWSVSGAPNPVSRTGLYEGPRPLLCVQAAYISVRLASCPLGRRAPKSKRYMAQLLRRGLELMDCAKRSCPAPEGSSEAPLSRNRRTADQECRGRSPHSPVQGLASLSRETVACIADLLGRPEPAGHQSIRSRGEVCPRGGRAQRPSYLGNS